MADAIQSTALATIQDPDLATLDHKELGAWVELLQERSDDVVLAMGKALLHAKSTMSHGEWGAWVKHYWHKSDRTARDYMHYAQIGSALPISTGTSIRQALAKVRKPRKQASPKEQIVVEPAVPAPQPPKPGEPCPTCGHVAPRPASVVGIDAGSGPSFTVTRSEDDWQWKRQANPKPAAPSKPKTRY